MTATSTRLFDAPQLSFILFASPKSGTTWLQRLLSNHPDVLCAESRLFGHYFASNPQGHPHLTLEMYIATLSRYYAPAVDGLRQSARRSAARDGGREFLSDAALQHGRHLRRDESRGHR